MVYVVCDMAIMPSTRSEHVSIVKTAAAVFLLLVLESLLGIGDGECCTLFANRSP